MATRKPIEINASDEDRDLVTTGCFVAAGEAGTAGVVLSSVIISKEEMQFERRNTDMRIAISMISSGGNH
jgi:hypothetical protein